VLATVFLRHSVYQVLSHNLQRFKLGEVLIFGFGRDAHAFAVRSGEVDIQDAARCSGLNLHCWSPLVWLLVTARWSLSSVALAPCQLAKQGESAHRLVRGRTERFLVR
jgi:hypothetical protein